MKMEEVEEQSTDTPMTVPVVDPTVVDPTPTTTNTPIPTQLVGLTFKGHNATSDKGDFELSVFGVSAKVRKVAFVIDASGSMMDVLPFVVREMKGAVHSLSPHHHITVIIFSGKGVYEVPGGGGVRGLRACDPKFKEGIREWLSLEHFKYETGGHGSKHAEAAIQKALSYKPHSVYLLSDNLTGGGLGATKHEISQDKLMKSISEANKFDPPARFNTIQFLKEDPLVKAGLKATLQWIADETGGTYKFISERDLKLEK